MKSRMLIQGTFWALLCLIPASVFAINIPKSGVDIYQFTGGTSDAQRHGWVEKISIKNAEDGTYNVSYGEGDTVRLDSEQLDLFLQSSTSRSWLRELAYIWNDMPMKFIPTALFAGVALSSIPGIVTTAGGLFAILARDSIAEIFVMRKPFSLLRKEQLNASKIEVSGETFSQLRNNLYRIQLRSR